MSSFGLLRLSVVLVMLAVCCSLSAQPIYKTVDEDGNVVYTDRKPDENSVPMELPELSVVNPVDLGDVNAVRSEDPAGSGDNAATPVLRLLSPSQEQTFQNTGYVLPVQVAVDGALPPGSQLAYLLDGQVREAGTSMSVALEEVFRGQHQVQVQLRGSNGQVLASTESVTIFMHQASAQHPNPN